MTNDNADIFEVSAIEINRTGRDQNDEDTDNYWPVDKGFYMIR